MMRRPGLGRRLAKIGAALVVGWLVLLVILGFAIGDRTASQVTSRIADSLQGSGRHADHDLALVRGILQVSQLEVRRDDVVGKLDLTVAEIECDLPPFGLAMLDRDCDELAIRGLRLEVSTFALFKSHRPRRTPFHAGGITLDDATLVLSPTALAPSLGKTELRVHHAHAGATTFKTPLSFLFALDSLRATLALPAGLVVELTYANRLLTVSGGVFGSEPVTLPVELPVADLADDPQAELKKLVAFARQIAEEAITRRAADWFREKTGI
ncbi:MAG: hypothetical protein WKG01_06880 [Kofleriaceae bacterium]